MGEYDYSELEDDQFLSLVGRLVGRDAWPDAVVVPSRRQPVERLRARLAEPAAGRPLLVVGESGVGKSAIVGHALRELPEDDDWAVLWSAASEVIAGAIYIGQLEQRVQELVHRIRHRDVVWVVPQFEETLYAGQYHGHPRGLLDALLPHLETGGIRLIGEIDPAAYEQLVQRRPKVVELFEVIRLPAMPADEALAIGAAWAAERHVEIDEATLREAADFAEHYLPGLAAPGNLLRLLDMSGQRAAREGASAVTPTLVIEALASATAMPLELLDPRKPIDVDALRETLAARVLGQPEAVDCLVERIALLKAGLTDPGRPLGVFLFVGPTGTGKTELAKALAESMFGSETRLVRLDMSEFQTPESLERLLAESAGPDAPSAGLVSALRQQPFSVVLLDEFEKAHANVWDVFLQVFDDGRLTDNAGRVVDFRHAVIILTSNVGSAVSTAPALGFVGERAPFAREGVERAVSQVFRPEFLNRLDRVVVFRPLERSLMRDLVVKELRQMIERRGFRARPWTVEWDDAAIDFLVDRGFSAELGARPLRRAIEQELLAPLALEVVGHRAPRGDQFLLITADRRGRLRVRFVDAHADDPVDAAEADESGDWSLARIALRPQRTRAEAAFLVAEEQRVAAAVADWCATKDDLLAAMRDPDFWEAPDRFATLARVEYLDRLEAAAGTAERLTQRLAAGTRGDTRPAGDLVRLVAGRLHVLTCALEERGSDEVLDAAITVSSGTGHGHDPAAAEEFAHRLESMYLDWSERRGMRVEQADGERPRLGVSGLAAYSILRPEHGLHVLESGTGDETRRVFAHVAVAPVSLSAPGSAGAAPHSTEIVRRYRFEPSPLVRDRRGWRTGRVEQVLAGDFDLFA